MPFSSSVGGLFSYFTLGVVLRVVGGLTVLSLFVFSCFCRVRGRAVGYGRSYGCGGFLPRGST